MTAPRFGQPIPPTFGDPATGRPDAQGDAHPSYEEEVRAAGAEPIALIEPDERCPECSYPIEYTRLDGGGLVRATSCPRCGREYATLTPESVERLSLDW